MKKRRRTKREHLDAAVHDLVQRLVNVYRDRIVSIEQPNAGEASALLTRAQAALARGDYRAALDLVRAVDVIID